MNATGQAPNSSARPNTQTQARGTGAEGHTGEVFELEVGLSAVGEEVGVARLQIQRLRVEIKGELEVVVDESVLRLHLQIHRHYGERAIAHDLDPIKEHHTAEERQLQKIYIKEGILEASSRKRRRPRLGFLFLLFK